MRLAPVGLDGLASAICRMRMYPPRYSNIRNKRDAFVIEFWLDSGHLVRFGPKISQDAKLKPSTTTICGFPARHLVRFRAKTKCHKNRPISKASRLFRILE